MNKSLDTIAAISTPIGNGGIGIVRISGDNALNILDKIFKTNKNVFEIKSHTINYGHIKDDDQIIDEVLVSIMLAPKTYTCENIVEINCHGGIKSLNLVLDTVLKYGARLAEPGEFTKRAFLNGRIDLSQAEAVIDIINSKTELSHKIALKQLDGNLSSKIGELRDKVILMIATIEASIDYPEHDMEELNLKEVRSKSLELIKEIDLLIDGESKGKILKEGLETVILGRPNVGKSSLLNVILKEERAIVTDVEGTTRDILQEYVNIKGIPLKLIDTAGIRHTNDIVEKIGVEKSKKIAENSDLVLIILDNSKDLIEDDIDLLKKYNKDDSIIILNKIDLESKLDEATLFKYVDKEQIIRISTKEFLGLEDLYNKIKQMFFNGDLNISDEIIISKARHKESLINAKNSLENVIKTIDDGFTEDFISIDLQDSYKYLGEITGETLEEDIIDKIFSEFCLGK